MDITNLIEFIPEDIKNHVIDYQDVRLKDGRYAMRVLCDCILSARQKKLMQDNKHIIGLECIAQYKYAPEIKHSYFYVVR